MCFSLGSAQGLAHGGASGNVCGIRAATVTATVGEGRGEVAFNPPAYNFLGDLRLVHTLSGSPGFSSVN